jgi:hypothetical protein
MAIAMRATLKKGKRAISWKKIWVGERGKEIRKEREM